jgi:hypothetical protein
MRFTPSPTSLFFFFFFLVSVMCFGAHFVLLAYYNYYLCLTVRATLLFGSELVPCTFPQLPLLCLFGVVS